MPGQTIDDFALFSLPVFFPQQALHNKGRMTQTQLLFAARRMYLEEGNYYLAHIILLNILEYSD